MDSNQDLEIVMGYLGDFGKYQFWQFILHLLAALTAGMHMMSLVTVAAVPDHRCAIPELDFTNHSVPTYSFEGLTSYIPKLTDGEYDSCHMFTEINKTTIMPCTSWVYDKTYHKSSRAIEWNFVCNQRWMGAVAQSAYMFGVFFGAVTLGNAADKYGRKKIFCWCALLQLVFGVAVAFIPEYYTFLVVRLLFGIFGSAGSYITGFVLTMELVGPTKRSPCGISFQAAFAIGIMLVAGWGAIIPNRQILQVVYGLHSLLLAGHWWLMDESPRWLWAQGRITEAIKIVQKALKVNKSSIQLNPTDYITKPRIQTQETESNVGMANLFKTPNLRKKTLNLCLSWFANSLVYYGLSLNIGKLKGNPFLLLFLISVVELPCYVLTTYIMDKTGRRALISFLMITGGICCIAAAEMTKGSIMALCIVMLGKFFISGSFAIIYNYSAELFPTVIRNSGIGLGSMCARLSGTLTPLITLLDSFDPTLPSIIFAVLAIISGFLMLFLPETLGSPMPETLEDGETYGVGDTFFKQCCGSKKKNKHRRHVENGEQMQPLNKV